VADTQQTVLTVRTVLTETVTELREQTGLAVSAACTLVGVARSSFYRLTRGYQHYTPVTTAVPHRDRVQPAALSPAEKACILTALTAEEYTDLSVVQCYWRPSTRER
jgi:putative transposase